MRFATFARNALGFAVFAIVVTAPALLQPGCRSESEAKVEAPPGPAVLAEEVGAWSGELEAVIAAPWTASGPLAETARTERQQIEIARAELEALAGPDLATKAGLEDRIEARRRWIEERRPRLDGFLEMWREDSERFEATWVRVRRGNDILRRLIEAGVRTEEATPRLRAASREFETACRFWCEAASARLAGDATEGPGRDLGRGSLAPVEATLARELPRLERAHRELTVLELGLRREREALEDPEGDADAIRARRARLEDEILPRVEALRPALLERPEGFDADWSSLLAKLRA
ncbi:MAG: hypothetical protein R3F20_14890 [Planctomycetota bacterium]